MPARVAIAHDWLCGYRGGEAVLDRIARLVTRRFRCAGLWTMFDDGRGLTPVVDTLPKHTSILQRVPGGPGVLRRWLLPLYPRAVESLSRSLAREHAREPLDLVVSTSSAAVKGIRAPAGAAHVCYCHSPARYLWSQQAAYSSGLRGAGLRMFGGRLRAWDRATASNVTQFIANSTHTREEIHRCYARDSAVVFPPARTEFFGIDTSTRREEFWLLVGALEPYKRADIAIDAANQSRRELVVVGDGSMRRELRRRAGPTVRFEGRVSDERLRDLYQRASVLLFPQVEDFGIIAVEAQACGLPVIARSAGGSRDTVIAGETGMLFDEPTPGALLGAIDRFERSGRGASEWAACCRRNAQRFSEARFDESMLGIMLASLERAPTGARSGKLGI